MKEKRKKEDRKKTEEREQDRKLTRQERAQLTRLTHREKGSGRGKEGELTRDLDSLV